MSIRLVTYLPVSEEDRVVKMPPTRESLRTLLHLIVERVHLVCQVEDIDRESSAVFLIHYGNKAVVSVLWTDLNPFHVARMKDWIQGPEDPDEESQLLYFNRECLARLKAIYNQH